MGLGIDIVAIARIERALERHGDRLWERILTPDEREELAGRRTDRPVALAGRFAAKEALSKALGAPPDVWWQDVRVLRGKGGGPEITLSGAGEARARKLGVARSLLSITHDAGVAAAVVVLEGA